MARRLAREAVLEIAFGGPDDGSAPVWGASVSIVAQLRRFEIRANGEVIDVAGLSDANKRMRWAGGNEFTATLEGFSATNTPLFYTGTAQDENPVGHRVRVRYKPIGALTVNHDFAGIVEEWNVQAERYGEQGFRIVVRGPLDT